MTPELPRAPMSDPWVTAWQTSPSGASSPSLAISTTTASIVSDMLVPVSPSGTGNTLSLLTSSLRSLSAEAAASIRTWNDGPLRSLMHALPFGSLADFDALHVDLDGLDLDLGVGGHHVLHAVGHVVTHLGQVRAVLGDDIEVDAHSVANALDCDSPAKLVEREKLRDTVAELLSLDKLRRGVAVKSVGDGVRVDLYVVAEYGTNLTEVGHNMADRVKYVMTANAEVKVEAVEIHVQGVKVRK